MQLSAVRKTIRRVRRLPRPFGIPPFESCAIAQTTTNTAGGRN
jgi:hypothetical protein